jgi:hypothetical protein
MKELVVMLHHLLHFEDNGAEITIEEMYGSVPRNKVMVDKRVAEAALYACNVMDEMGDFWHPDGKRFDTFLKDVLQSDEKFDKFYNTIERGSGEEKK